MEYTALIHLENNALAAHERFTASLPVNTTALPADYNVHDLQHFQPLRRRFKGALATTSLADFVAYVRRTAKGEGYIDAEKLTAKAIFNLGNETEPGHCDWTASLQLQKSAAFHALGAVDGKNMSQKAAAEWLEDWAPHLRPFRAPSDEPTEGVTEYYGTLGKALSAVRAITIKSTSEGESNVGDFSGRRTAMEEVEARSRHELPGGFTFTCTPYLGLPERKFSLRLGVLTGGDVPVLVLRVQQFEADKEAIAQDFKRVLLEEIGDTCPMFIGTFAP